MRHEPKLAAEFQKIASEEEFLSHLNAILGPYQDAEYTRLPELYPTLHVVGAPRSGTTLMTQLLAGHLSVGYINNLIAAFWQAPIYGIRLSQKLLNRHHSPSYQSRYGRTSALQEPHEFGYFWSRMLNCSDMCQPRNEQANSIDWSRLAMVLTNMTHAFAAPVLFKSLHLCWHLQRLVEVLPRTCVVHIHRDPFDNALSIIKARREYGGSVEQWISLKPRACEQFDVEPYWKQAAAQVHYLEQALAEQFERIPAANILHVQYTELCNAPLQVLRGVQTMLAEQGAEVELIGTPPAEFPLATYREDQNEMERELRWFVNQIGTPSQESARRGSTSKLTARQV